MTHRIMGAIEKLVIGVCEVVVLAVELINYVY